MGKDHMDSATLTALDCAAPNCGCEPAADAFPYKPKRKTKDKRFSDPGGASPGPSIKCPNIYEALKRKGYSKEKAARISNSKAGSSGCN